jgi:hypothetical protein
MTIFLWCTAIYFISLLVMRSVMEEALDMLQYDEEWKRNILRSLVPLLPIVNTISCLFWCEQRIRRWWRNRKERRLVKKINKINAKNGVCSLEEFAAMSDEEREQYAAWVNEHTDGRVKIWKEGTKKP